MGVWKKIGLLLLFMPFLGMVQANNVRIVEEASVDETSILNDVATVSMKIAWDNSWRDDFNWDAVYIFIKYRIKGEEEWKHAYLMDGGHTLSGSAFECWTAKTGTTLNQCMGVFVQRSSKGSGDVSVSLGLKWQITQNGLKTTDFMNQKVEYQASCIEMVYVPQGAFCLGDGVSEGTFQTAYRPILPEWDVIKNDGTMSFKASGDATTEDYKNYPPENAANRVNENRTNTYSNAWYATAKGESNWQVDFKDKPRAIRYFGVSGVRGYGEYRPISWELQARNEDTEWITLWSGAKDSWVIEDNSYPVQRALEVNPDRLKKYRYYQIHVITSDYRVMANNIAMTEVDMSKMTQDAYVMDKASNITLNMKTKLSAQDKDKWDGTLPADYPTGFNGFYAMKYEISQEQWVRFLNKLEYQQQKQRTVGDRLDQLMAGDYVYGDKKKANCRNGIAIGARDNGNIVFVNNLNKSNPFAQADDGQNIACNYLSPDDMLAYADWCGLRPLSEMEYEKMARAPYPAVPRHEEWAGGAKEALVKPGADAISNARTKEERLKQNAGKKVNINAGAVLDGPVRVGCLAVNGMTQESTGAGYWGIMDLSGNLAEIYYNVTNGMGRTFSDVQASHGDGKLYGISNADRVGDADISESYWPHKPGAFMLRGGSFMSADKRVAISDRSANGYFSNLNAKDSLVTFRVGHSYTKLSAEKHPETFLFLANGTSTAQGSAPAIDSVCSASLYTIRGTAMDDIAEYTGEKYSFIWYKSENKGQTWDIIRGEEGQNLSYSNFYNDGGDLSEVWFKRKTITNTWWSETNYVRILVINTSFEFNRLQDTITLANHVLGFWVDTKTLAKFTWTWKSDLGEVILRRSRNFDHWDYYAPLRSKFNKETGDQRLICEINFLNRCVRKQELPLHIVKRPSVGVEPSLIAIHAKDPKYECGVVMQDNRSAHKDIYATVKIGNQCWMAENLRYPISGMSLFSDKDPGGEILGAYYKYSPEILNNACPPGWKIPTWDDFTKLQNYLNETYGKAMAGAVMKQGAFWRVDNSYKEHLGNNLSGFGAVGTGFYNGNSVNEYVSTDRENQCFSQGHFAIDNNGYGYESYLSYSSSSLDYSYRWYYPYWYGYYNNMPIRCIKK